MIHQASNTGAGVSWNSLRLCLLLAVCIAVAPAGCTPAGFTSANSVGDTVGITRNNRRTEDQSPLLLSPRKPAATIIGGDAMVGSTRSDLRARSRSALLVPRGQSYLLDKRGCFSALRDAFGSCAVRLGRVLGKDLRDKKRTRSGRAWETEEDVERGLIKDKKKKRQWKPSRLVIKPNRTLSLTKLTRTKSGLRAAQSASPLDGVVNSPDDMAEVELRLEPSAKSLDDAIKHAVRPETPPHAGNYSPVERADLIDEAREVPFRREGQNGLALEHHPHQHPPPYLAHQLQQQREIAMQHAQALVMPGAGGALHPGGMPALPGLF